MNAHFALLGSFFSRINALNAKRIACYASTKKIAAYAKKEPSKKKTVAMIVLKTVFPALVSGSAIHAFQGIFSRIVNAVAVMGAA